MPMSNAYKPAEGVLFKGVENFPKMYYSQETYERRVKEADEEKEEYSPTEEIILKFDAAEKLFNELRPYSMACTDEVVLPNGCFMTVYAMYPYYPECADQEFIVNPLMYFKTDSVLTARRFMDMLGELERMLGII